jgi:predicted metal-dependent phosphoesterase TrpH
MLAEAVSRGLDFLGVTDHNQTGHQCEYAQVHGDHLPIVLPGIEVTTYGGHWNAWGTDTWWEFREPTEAATSQAMQAAAASGALVSVNHPKPFGPAWEYPAAVGYHAIEVWNGDWSRQNDVSLSWWDQQLCAGRRIVALGGSDTHNLKVTDADARHGRHLGQPTTWVDAGDDRSAQAVLAALRAGRAFISRDVAGPQLYFTRDVEGFRVRVIDGSQASLVMVSEHGVETIVTIPGGDWSETLRVRQAQTYVRAQLMDQDQHEMLALTNAVFVTDRAAADC